MWEHFLNCVRDHNRATLCPPELGAAAVTIASMGVASYRSGQVLVWDKEQDACRPPTAPGRALGSEQPGARTLRGHAAAEVHGASGK